MKLDAIDEKWMESLKKEKTGIKQRPARKVDEDFVAPNGFVMEGKNEAPLVPGA